MSGGYVPTRPGAEQGAGDVARVAYMLGVVNMALRQSLGDNLADVRVAPAGGWLEFSLRRPAKQGKVYRLAIEERDELAMFPPESEGQQ